MVRLCVLESCFHNCSVITTIRLEKLLDSLLYLEPFSALLEKQNPVYFPLELKVALQI